MSKADNVAAQERFGAEVANAGKVEVIDELCAPDFLDHDPAPDQGPGPEGFKSFWSTFRTGFPDLAVEAVCMVADDDSVALAYRATGTHQGDYAGHASTGKPIDVRGVQVTRFADGRMVERWGSSDELGILKQIGVLR